MTLYVLRVGRASGEESAGIEVQNVFVFNLLRSLMQQDISMDVLSSLSLKDFLAGLKKNEQGYYFDSVFSQEVVNPQRQRRALIIDQFDEIFSTHPEAWDKREELFIQLQQWSVQTAYPKPVE